MWEEGNQGRVHRGEEGNQGRVHRGEEVGSRQGT